MDDACRRMLSQSLSRPSPDPREPSIPVRREDPSESSSDQDEIESRPAPVVEADTQRRRRARPVREALEPLPSTPRTRAYPRTESKYRAAAAAAPFLEEAMSDDVLPPNDALTTLYLRVRRGFRDLTQTPDTVLIARGLKHLVWAIVCLGMAMVSVTSRITFSMVKTVAKYAAHGMLLLPTLMSDNFKATRQHAWEIWQHLFDRRRSSAPATPPTADPPPSTPRASREARRTPEPDPEQIEASPIEASPNNPAIPWAIHTERAADTSSFPSPEVSSILPSVDQTPWWVWAVNQAQATIHGGLLFVGTKLALSYGPSLAQHCLPGGEGAPLLT